MHSNDKPKPKMLNGGGLAVPKEVDERVKRASAYLDTLIPQHQVCWEFYRNNHYAYLSHENKLLYQPTSTSVRAGGKPPHKVRHSRDILYPLVRSEVSFATSRVPAYEVQATTDDSKAINAAKISELVAQYGYDKWGFLDVTEKVVTSAVVADEGFARVYWDASVGPIVGKDDEGVPLHQGEVAATCYTSSEVGWEPGTQFEDSPYWVVKKKIPVDVVKARPGYFGGELQPDAMSERRTGKDKQQSKLVVLTEYLERPSDECPAGRRIEIANGKQIRPEEGYPLVDHNGEPLDEPPLVKLGVATDPDGDRDMGLVCRAIDPIRAHDDCWNKILEWKNLTTAPQLVTTPGNLRGKVTQEPGAVMLANRPENVQWRPVPQPPQMLVQVAQEAHENVKALFSWNDIPASVDSAAGRQAEIDRDNTARGMFIRKLAEFHSRMMRHALTLVARHYTEPRLLEIKGEFGPESLKDFLGTDLQGQVNVRVSPASIEPRTKQAVEARLTKWAEMGWISPTAAMSAIQGGTGAALIDKFEYDAARAQRIVRRAFEDPEGMLGQPPGPDDQPEWMPRPFDNIAVHKDTVETAMKTERYETASPVTKQILHLYYEGLKKLESDQKAEEMAQQTAMAEQLGRKNAAAPQSKDMPDQPSPDTIAQQLAS